MNNDEFNFILFDRIEKIKQINNMLDLENNSYLSFSGGKDSTILHYLIDMALPNNKIPRIYANTGIEYSDVVKFVKSLSLNDERFIIVNQDLNIKDTLNKYGYPFKSKEHSLRVYQFNIGSNANYINKYINGYNTSNGKSSHFVCPKKLLYQFKNRGEFNYSNLCCYKLKKRLLHIVQKKLNKSIIITGMRSEEGGNRSRLTCLTQNNTMFHPLIVCSEEFENMFIDIFNIKLCKLYYPPYNFVRTGCKGCPFSLTLKHDLEVMRHLLPNEYKQCEILWSPVYSEYRRIGYRLPSAEQLTLF